MEKYKKAELSDDKSSIKSYNILLVKIDAFQ